MTTNSRYTPPIITGLAIGLVALFVAGVVGSPTLGLAEQYESAWEIPNWGSTSFPATPQAIALGDQAVLLRTLHIFLDQGLAFLLVPPLFLCALLKLSDFAKRFILARAANRTICLASNLIHAGNGIRRHCRNSHNARRAAFYSRFCHRSLPPKRRHTMVALEVYGIPLGDFDLLSDPTCLMRAVQNQAGGPDDFMVSSQNSVLVARRDMHGGSRRTANLPVPFGARK